MHNIDLSSLDSEDDALDHEEDLKFQIEDELMDNSEEKELSGILKKVKKQVPSLFKLGALVGSKLPKKKLAPQEKDDSQKPTKEPKKKTKFKVIHVVFLLGFAFLLFEEELIGTEETKSEKNPVAVNKPKIKPVDKAPQIAPKAEPSTDDPLMIGNSKPLVQDAKEEVTQVDPEPVKASEDITDLFKDEMDIDSSINNNSENVDDAIESINAQADAIKESESNSQINTETDEVADDSNIDTTDSDDTISDKAMSEVEDAKAALDEKRIEKSKAIVESKVVDDITDDFLVKDFDSGQDITKSIIDDLQKKVENKKNQDLINKNANYDLLDSVNYELPGRGLVYNCNDGHWACVNIKSYSYCQNNYNYDLQNQKQIQCYPSAIYEGSIDCEDEQLNKVSNSASTKFCN